MRLIGLPIGRVPIVEKKLPERRGYGERERAYTGGLGAEPPAGSGGGAPSGVWGHEPLVGGSGGEAPLKLKAFELSSIQWKRQKCLVFSTL